MKKSLSVLIFTLCLSNAFAAAERPCPAQVLTCKLEKQLSSGGRTLIATSESPFDGTNADEPSVPPASCTAFASLQDKDGIIFNVSLDEAELMTYVYLVKSSQPGSMLPGDTAFNATAGKAFYYRYNDSLLTCVLK